MQHRFDAPCDVLVYLLCYAILVILSPNAPMLMLWSIVWIQIENAFHMKLFPDVGIYLNHVSKVHATANVTALICPNSWYFLFIFKYADMRIY